jgi:hypothetical protein
MPGPSDKADAPIRWRCVDGIHVMYAEAEVSVSEELWDACMRDRNGPEIRGCLSIIGGDGVTQISRRQWLVSASIMIQRGFPVAMLSSHRITLAMVRSAAWSGANIQAFKWAELDAALEFIGVLPSGRPTLQRVAEELRKGGA